MKRTYSAPVSEFLTFRVDAVIASNCGVTASDKNTTDSSTCSANIGGFIIFSDTVNTCDYTDVKDYCYYTNTQEQLLFSS